MKNGPGMTHLKTVIVFNYNKIMWHDAKWVID